MKVILIQDVKALGRKGDVKEVADGYARNYLFKNKLAQPADKANMNSLNHELKLQMQREAAAKAKAESVAQALKDKTVVLKVKCGEAGRLFGSVTNGDVAAALRSHLLARVHPAEQPVVPAVLDVLDQRKSIGHFLFLLVVYTAQFCIIA